MLIEEIKYIENATNIFDQISNLPYSVYLDSNYYSNLKGQFDIISASPETVLATFGNTTKIITNDKITYSIDNPLNILKKHLPRQEPTNINIPFIGGAIGFFGYDFAYQIYNLPKYIPNDYKFPDMLFGIYNWAIVNDHNLKKSFFIQHKTDIKQFNMIQKYINKKAKKKNHVQPIKFQSNINFSKYASSFEKIKSHIENGDCYQVNLSQRFEGINQNNPWDIYKQITPKSQANFAAYFNTEYGQIICQSPERFIKIQDRKLETNPIKGTIKKDNANITSSLMANNLLNSQKNRAENLMIVDLLRNDLYKSCKAESILVDKFCDLLTLPSLFHLESKITGYLTENLHPVDAIKHAFPGGSITGAPKFRAMQISESVEHRRRSIFCGSIAYISYNGNVDSNIIIRTLLAKNKKIYTWAGGGIVSGSTLRSEYNETLAKLDNIFRTL